MYKRTTQCLYKIEIQVGIPILILRVCLLLWANVGIYYYILKSTRPKNSYTIRPVV